MSRELISDNIQSIKGIEIIEQNGYVEFVINKDADNFIDTEFLDAVEYLIDLIERSKTVNCVFFRSKVDGVFSKGLDVRHFKNDGTTDLIPFIERSNKILYQIENLPVLTVSLIDGNCMGAGLEFALASDIRVSSCHSKFASPEIIYGLIPGGGAIQRLVRSVGKGTAMLMLFSGRIIDARRALEVGLVQEVVDDDLVQWANQLGRKLKRLNNSHIGKMKNAVNFGIENKFSDSIKNDLEISINLLKTY